MRFHETGNTAPQLNGVQVVVFLLADPLRETYPDCYAEAVELERRARARGVRVVNPPDALSNSIKSVQSRLWREAGIPTPLVRRFETVQQLWSLSARLQYPVLIGADEQQGPRTIHVCEDPQAVSAIPSTDIRLPGAVASIADVRQGFRERDPGTVWARLFHKKRLLVLGGKVRTKHVFFSRYPVVTTSTCKFRRYRGRWGRLAWLARIDRWSAACVHADLEYWRRGREHDGLMRRATETLGLGFAAIDYSSLADGGVILWEANPYPALPTTRDIMLPRRRHAKERVESYYDAIAGFFADLLANMSRGCAPV
jgi:hypothetical protein